MTSSHTPILLICYRFPPNPGIGGRRWAKFAKELARRGYEVHVIRAALDSAIENSSAWSSDVVSPRIKVYPMPRRFPAAFDRQFFCQKLSLTDKLTIRISRRVLPLVTRGASLDRTIFWRKQLRRKVTQLVRRFGIRSVIASGAPFRCLTFLAEMRAEGVISNLICDFRDPWLESQSMAALSSADREYEAKLEATVYQHADFLVAPNQYLIPERKYDLDLSVKRRVLRHPYDPADLTESSIAQDGLIRISYAGGLYPDTEPALRDFIAGLLSIKERSAELFGRLQCDFYTPDQKLAQLFESVKEVVAFHETIASTEVINRLQQSTFNLMFTADWTRNWMTTKFAELLAVRRPIIVVGPRGDVAAAVEQHGAGFAFEPGEVFAGLAQVLGDPANHKAVSTTYADQFSLSEVTNELVTMLDSLALEVR